VLFEDEPFPDDDSACAAGRNAINYYIDHGRWPGS
jgi:hypothetical protein